MRLSTLVGGAAEVIGREATLAEAADRMIEREVDCLAVVDGRNLVGVLSLIHISEPTRLWSGSRMPSSA